MSDARGKIVQCVIHGERALSENGQLAIVGLIAAAEKVLEDIIMNYTLIAELERAHNRLNCNVADSGREFKSPEERDAEIASALELCWKAKTEIDRLNQALSVAHRAGREEGLREAGALDSNYGHLIPREAILALIYTPDRPMPKGENNA